MDLISEVLSTGHKMPKDMYQSKKLKGKCALGPFLSILVIECQHKVLKCEFMPMDEQSANHE
jgi:hypothetical protein